LGRQFSGERLKRVVNGDWLTKDRVCRRDRGGPSTSFLLTTAKSRRRKKKEARVVAQVEEPSVRDFVPR